EGAGGGIDGDERRPGGRGRAPARAALRRPHALRDPRPEAAARACRQVPQGDGCDPVRASAQARGPEVVRERVRDKGRRPGAQSRGQGLADPLTPVKSEKPPGGSSMSKYVFVTGGVVSSLGKGITAASIGNILKARHLTLSLQKLDPYLNVDPGTMSPYQHGEVFVTDDGAETDLDLGHYERFVDENLTV